MDGSRRVKAPPLLSTPNIATVVHRDFCMYMGIMLSALTPRRITTDAMASDRLSSSAYVIDPSHALTAGESGDLWQSLRVTWCTQVSHNPNLPCSFSPSVATSMLRTVGLSLDVLYGRI
jgi:hypothetical protein